MLEKVIIIICIAVCLGAAIFAWWMENGPSHEDDKNSENDRIIPTKEINITRHDMENMK